MTTKIRLSQGVWNLCIEFDTFDANTSSLHLVYLLTIFRCVKPTQTNKPHGRFPQLRIRHFSVVELVHYISPSQGSTRDPVKCQDLRLFRDREKMRPKVVSLVVVATFLV